MQGNIRQRMQRICQRNFKENSCPSLVVPIVLYEPAAPLGKLLPRRINLRMDILSFLGQNGTLKRQSALHETEERSYGFHPREHFPQELRLMFNIRNFLTRDGEDHFIAWYVPRASVVDHLRDRMPVARLKSLAV